MQTPKTIERRLFLASTAATVVANVTGCTEDGNSGPGTEPSSTNSSATGTHSSATGAHSTATSTGPTSSSQTSMTTGGTGGAGSSGVTSSGGSTSSVDTSQMNSSGADTSSVGTSGADTSSADSSEAQGSGTEAASSGETSASSGPTSSEPERPSEDACFESGGTDGGMAQDSGGGVLCSTNTDNGNHCHPLVVPQTDIDQGFAEATYNLEDGGTGHTHTVTITAYDVFYLQAGIAHEIESSDEEGHTHMCLITCSG